MTTPSARAPSISVVVPLYNHARFIESTLESVLGQTSPPDEIVLIDDGSHDEGVAIAEAALRGHPQARVFRQPNQGAHVTINRLIETSRSDYIAILNSDDRFLPGKLARCRDILSRRPEVELICGKAAIMNDDGTPQTDGVAVDWLARAAQFRARGASLPLSLFNENYVATTSNMVFSRAIWERCGGFQNLRYCHDLDFLFAALLRGTVEIDDEAEHILYRVHEGNTIKEDLSRIRVEIAAVLAVALADHGTRLLDNRFDQTQVELLFEALDNKGMTKLILLLQIWYGGFADRTSFYAFLAEPERAAMLRGLLA